MATRTKTIEFATKGAAFADNTLSTATQITVYIPESGKTFRSVYAILSVGTLATATGNLTSRNLQCRLGAAAYTANSNANLYTGSAEDLFIFHAVDLTAHFTANWTGTSMTFDSQYQLDGTWTGVSFVNPCVTLVITYDYDDTSATQIKTIKMPLNAPATALATTAGSAEDTIPVLNTELPESSKVYRDAFITVQGNVERAGTGDPTLSIVVAASAAVTSSVFEGVSNTDYFYRWLVKDSEIANWDETLTMAFDIYASAADFDHPQVWLTVTYEFDATASTDCYVSVMLPVGEANMGGTTSSDWTRIEAELWVPEAGVVSKRIAFFPFWTQIAAIAGLNMRVGTGSFVAYSSVAATVAGSCAAMIRNDAAFTLAQGKNTLTADAYRTDATDLGVGLSGFWLVTYTCDKPSGGYGAANHTVLSNNGTVFNGASVTTTLTAAINTPQGFTSWSQKRFISNLALTVLFYANSTGQSRGLEIQAERLTAENGGHSWQVVGTSAAQSDPESGLFVGCFDVTRHFKQFQGHLGRALDPVSARRWRVSSNDYTTARWFLLEWAVTYHETTFSVADSVSGFSGTVTLGLHMEKDDARFIDDVRVLETTRSGDGAYSFTWYDPVEQVYVVATDGTNVGRSTADTAV